MQKPEGKTFRFFLCKEASKLLLLRCKKLFCSQSNRNSDNE
jgi:hypothetical protein